MNKVQFLRDRADRYLDMAARAPTLPLVQKYLDLAGRYERMAREAVAAALAIGDADRGHRATRRPAG